MRRNVGIRVSAIFVLLWYFLGIIGFNVHTCNASNDSFIVTFLEDMSCDSIHPDEHCATVKTCCCCCGHDSEPASHSDESIEVSKCCTNEYQMLTSSADRVDETHRINLQDSAFCVGVLYSLNDLHTYSNASVSRMCSPPRSCHGERGIHLVCSVWRI